ncbi:MAG: D-alanyl-D-alanine carboxypeptidase (penicillin-binding protein 5/6) [Parcubacteria bacterium C7867-005]|nr:MAG: D-alanyl-D-alanine carboxypeptidase (penicillin-binding protein 5/6) [Parcubacteria bacterium C7867-005]
MTIHTPILTNKHELRFIAALGVLLVALILISTIMSNKVMRDGTSVPSEVVINPFDSVEINAKAAYVFDIRENKIIYSKNESERLPLASLTKVMSALVAISIAPEESVITITNKAIRTDGDSGLRVGERWSLKDLLDFSLTSSSNDGTKAVALALGAIGKSDATDKEKEVDFINSMNTMANKLGMKNTYFFNETGLDESDKKGGAYGSAKDVASLFAYILKNNPNLLEATKHDTITIRSMDNFVHTAVNTDQIVADIPGIKGSKTGFTDIAGGNLVIAFDPELGRPIIISVLGSTAEERFRDVEKLVRATLLSLSAEPISNL